MLIDPLNIKRDKKQLFPFDINFPLVSFEKFGFIYVGSLVDFGDGFWLLSPHIYTKEGNYVPCASSFRVKPDEPLYKAVDSDEIRYAFKDAEFNIGLISGIPFSLTTRIH